MGSSARETPRTERPGEPRESGIAAGPPPGQSRRRRARFAPWISAALVAGAASLFVRDLLVPPRAEGGLADEQRRLLPGSAPAPTALTIRLPASRVSAFGTIAFDAPPNPGGWYRIEVREGEAPQTSEPLLLLERTEQTAWTPSGEDLYRLPESIAITVRAFDATGAPTLSTTARSRRDPR